MKLYLIIGLVCGTINLIANYAIGNLKSENRNELFCLILGLAIGYILWPLQIYYGLKVLIDYLKTEEQIRENLRLRKEYLKLCIGVLKVKYDRFWLFSLLGLGQLIGDWPKWLDNWHYVHYLRLVKLSYEHDPEQTIKDILENNDEDTIERLFKDLNINQN